MSETDCARGRVTHCWHETAVSENAAGRDVSEQCCWCGAERGVSFRWVRDGRHGRWAPASARTLTRVEG